MIVICDKCQLEYDDARRLTICPHDKLLPDEDMERKIKALQIFDSRKTYRVKGSGDELVGTISSVDAFGYVSLSCGDINEVYDPSCLEEVENATSTGN